jgi:hypothetical protein
VLPLPAPWRPEPYQDPTPTTTIARPHVPTRKKSRRGLLIGAAAILVGAAIGVFAVPKLLDKDNQATPRNPPATTHTTTTTPPPSTPPATGGDPAFAPTLDPLTDQGADITLTWSDPTNGKAQFVVVDVTDTDRKALATIAPGTTTYTVSDLDPAAPQYCFQVIGLGLEDPTTQHGASPQACTNR